MDLYQVSSYDAPGVKTGPASGVTSWNIGTKKKKKSKFGINIWYVASPCGPLPSLFIQCPWGKKWPLPRGHKLEHRNNEAHPQNFSSSKLDGVEIWYVASTCGPLPSLIIKCPRGQNQPRPGGHKFEA